MREVNIMELQELYYEVAKYINLIDFNKLCNGFKPLKFALYNDNECFFDGKYIEKSNEFLANTSIRYNNEVIAIWNVMEYMQPITLTSKLVHEMFHGYQMINEESRFPNEMEAIYNYCYSDENLSIKLLENKLINELIDKFDNDKFKRLLGLRKYRYNNFNYEYIYESKIEQIEGSANYVELNVLKQLSNELYLNKLNHMKESIVNPNNLLPIRVISYDIGALLLGVLKDNNIKFNEEFTDKSFGLDLIILVEPCLPNNYLCMQSYIDNYNKKSEEIINKAINNNNIIVDHNVELLGVNVYNARYYNNYIVSTYFVMYNDNNEQVVHYGDFVIKLNEIAKASKIYKI
jgi:hypothetical protein